MSVLLTPSQKRIRKKYTRASLIFNKWTAHLQVDHQGFSLHECRSRKSASWMCDMLAIALDRMISAEIELNKSRENSTAKEGK